MSRIIQIKGQEQIDRACEILQALPTDKDLQVEISEAKDRRSAAQNRLYWVWVTFLAGEQGLSKEDVHQDLKERILSVIFQRDDDNFATMVASLRHVYKLDREAGAQLYKGVCSLISTRDADVHQFTEYLEDIERDSTSRGIILPHPEDIYREAM